MHISLLLLMMGCSKLGNLGNALEAYKPNVKFNRLDLRDINFNKVDTTLVFDVNNPNPIDLGLASFAYTLSLEGQRLTAGDRDKGFNVPGEGAAELKIPLSVVFTDIPELLDNTRGKDELGFAVRGDMGFNTPLGVVELPYNAEGKMPVIRAPKVQVSALRVDELALLQNRATLALDLNVTNRGGAAIGLKNVGYGFKLNNRRVATGDVAQLGSIDGDGQETVTVPITFSLTEVGSGLIDLLKSKGQVNAQFNAELTVDTPFGAVPFSFDEGKRLSLQ
ncbi:MAG: LEA type 2 family protein [Myxococcota bacterium]